MEEKKIQIKVLQEKLTMVLFKLVFIVLGSLMIIGLFKDDSQLAGIGLAGVAVLIFPFFSFIGTKESQKRFPQNDYRIKNIKENLQDKIIKKSHKKEDDVCITKVFDIGQFNIYIEPRTNNYESGSCKKNEQHSKDMEANEFRIIISLKIINGAIEYHENEP